jgi:hypothetical protein
MMAVEPSPSASLSYASRTSGYYSLGQCLGPSSLLGQFDNAQVRTVGKLLDEKMGALADAIAH